VKSASFGLHSRTDQVRFNRTGFSAGGGLPLPAIAAGVAAFAVASAAGAVDCSKWSDHQPGYCGVLSNDKVCASSANRVPGKCNIPSAAWYVNSSQELINNQSQSVMATSGSYALVNPDGSAVSLVAAGGGNLVAAGGGNLVAAGGGNLVGGRSLQSVGGRKLFVLHR